MAISGEIVGKSHPFSFQSSYFHQTFESNVGKSKLFPFPFVFSRRPIDYPIVNLRKVDKDLLIPLFLCLTFNQVVRFLDSIASLEPFQFFDCIVILPVGDSVCSPTFCSWKETWQQQLAVAHPETSSHVLRLSRGNQLTERPDISPNSTTVPFFEALNQFSPSPSSSSQCRGWDSYRPQSHFSANQQKMIDSRHHCNFSSSTRSEQQGRQSISNRPSSESSESNRLHPVDGKVETHLQSHLHESHFSQKHRRKSAWFSSKSPTTTLPITGTRIMSGTSPTDRERDSVLSFPKGEAWNTEGAFSGRHSKETTNGGNLSSSHAEALCLDEFPDILPLSVPSQSCRTSPTGSKFGDVEVIKHRVDKTFLVLGGGEITKKKRAGAKETAKKTSDTAVKEGNNNENFSDDKRKKRKKRKKNKNKKNKGEDGRVSDDETGYTVPTSHFPEDAATVSGSFSSPIFESTSLRGFSLNQWDNSTQVADADEFPEIEQRQSPRQVSSLLPPSKPLHSHSGHSRQISPSPSIRVVKTPINQDFSCGLLPIDDSFSHLSLSGGIHTKDTENQLDHENDKSRCRQSRRERRKPSISQRLFCSGSSSSSPPLPSSSSHPIDESLPCRCVIFVFLGCEVCDNKTPRVIFCDFTVDFFEMKSCVALVQCPFCLEHGNFKRFFPSFVPY